MAARPGHSRIQRATDGYAIGIYNSVRSSLFGTVIGMFSYVS